MLSKCFYKIQTEWVIPQLKRLLLAFLPLGIVWKGCHGCWAPAWFGPGLFTQFRPLLPGPFPELQLQDSLCQECSSPDMSSLGGSPFRSRLSVPQGSIFWSFKLGQVLETFIAPVMSLVTCVPPGPQAHSFHLMLPLGRGSGYRESFASYVSLHLEQGQHLYSLGNDESAMPSKNLLFHHASHFNQKWAQRLGARRQEAKKVWQSQVLVWAKSQGPSMTHLQWVPQGICP